MTPEKILPAMQLDSAASACLFLDPEHCAYHSAMRLTYGCRKHLQYSTLSPIDYSVSGFPSRDGVCRTCRACRRGLECRRHGMPRFGLDDRQGIKRTNPSLP